MWWASRGLRAKRAAARGPDVKLVEVVSHDTPVEVAAGVIDVGAIVQLPASDEEAALIRLDQLDQQSRILDLGFSRIDLRDPEMVAVRPRQSSAASSGANGVG